MPSSLDSFAVKLRCRKPGHENQPLLFVYNGIFSSSNEYLYCSNCLISDQADNSTKMVNYRTFLEDRLSLETSMSDLISKNKKLIEIYSKEDNEVEMIRKFEEKRLDELFSMLVKQIKSEALILCITINFI